MAKRSARLWCFWSAHLLADLLNLAWRTWERVLIMPAYLNP